MSKEDKTTNNPNPVHTQKRGPGGPSRRGSHFIADAGGCEVRWFWYASEGLQAKKSNFYLDFGTLGHDAMAYFYADKMDRKPKWYIDYPNAQEILEEDAQDDDGDVDEDRLRTIQSIMENYKIFDAGSPITPLYIEEEWEVSVGELDPDGEDEPAEEFEYSDKGVKKVWSFPRLNDEIVTCRPDIVIEQNGIKSIFDHKFEGGSYKTDRLKVMNPQYPDYTYYWQAAYNLWVVRKGKCTDAAGSKLDVQDFVLNRVKRTVPFDVSRDKLDIPSRMMSKIPATVRATIKNSRILRKKALVNPKSLVAHPWECEGKYTCNYTRICYTNTLEERNHIIATEYNKKGT